MEDDGAFASLAAALKPMNTTKDIADRCGIKESTLAHWRSDGIGPKFVKVGRTVMYPKEPMIEILPRPPVPVHDRIRGGIGMKTIRKACVQAVFDEFETRGELVHAFADGDAKAMRPLGHIVGYVDLDVTGIVDLIVDTINKEL